MTPKSTAARSEGLQIAEKITLSRFELSGEGVDWNVLSRPSAFGAFMRGKPDYHGQVYYAIYIEA